MPSLCRLRLSFKERESLRRKRRLGEKKKREKFPARFCEKEKRGREDRERERETEREREAEREHGTARRGGMFGRLKSKIMGAGARLKRRRGNEEEGGTSTSKRLEVIEVLDEGAGGAEATQTDVDKYLKKIDAIKSSARESVYMGNLSAEVRIRFSSFFSFVLLLVFFF